MAKMSIILDLIVLASAIELLFFTGSVDGWHRFGYYLAGAGLGFYVSYRYVTHRRLNNGQSN